MPAIISYVALFYIVHLEALKYDLKVIPRGYVRTSGQRVLGWSLGVSGTLAACALIYYGITFVRWIFGENATWALAGLTLTVYVALLGCSARYPDVPQDDPLAPVLHLPEPWPTVRAGLHFFIPIVVLLWCLMVEELSPGTSAFWATATVIVLVVVQPAILAFFRRTGEAWAGLRKGVDDLRKGLILGARSMIGIGVACASAGLIVGVITLTGMGLMMTDFVEQISAGNVLIMLMLTAVICLLIGAGVPTTANYILVATLMAPVIVELGARSGLVIPLIAVHLFVFYFGIMADVTPPVGLASYAAAAISGDDPNATGLQATWYSFRTAILPFVFIFNPQILLIGVGSWWEIVIVATRATVASLLFAAATMGWFRARCNWLEIGLLLVATFLFFRPDWIIDRFYAKYVSIPAKEVFKTAESLGPDEWLAVTIAGESIEGKAIRKTVALPLGEGANGRERLRSGGVTLAALGEDLEVSNVKFGSRAKKLGVEQGFRIVEVKVLNPARPSPHWVFLPAGLLVALIWFLQRTRVRRVAVAPTL